MDNHALTDGLSQALTSSTTQFTAAIKGLAPSPSTKNSRSQKSNQEEIIMVLQEIKGINEINNDGSYNKNLRDAQARLNYLQGKRDNGNGRVIDFTKE